MKKLFLIAILSLGTLANAQEKEKKQRTPEQRLEMHANKLAKELTLNQDQKAKVLVALKERQAAMPEKKELSDDEKKAMRKKMKAEQEIFNSKMKEILSSEQFEKFTALQKEKAEKMKKHHD